MKLHENSKYNPFCIFCWLYGNNNDRPISECGLFYIWIYKININFMYLYLIRLLYLRLNCSTFYFIELSSLMSLVFIERSNEWKQHFIIFRIYILTDKYSQIYKSQGCIGYTKTVEDLCNKKNPLTNSKLHLMWICLKKLKPYFLIFFL